MEYSHHILQVSNFEDEILLRGESVRPAYLIFRRVVRDAFYVIKAVFY